METGVLGAHFLLTVLYGVEAEHKRDPVHVIIRVLQMVECHV